MKIEIKKSKKPVDYYRAIRFLEKRMLNIQKKRASELIWVLEHPSVYTAGLRSNNEEILDKSIKILKTNRGGKITYHGPGQIICYFVINLNYRGKDLRKFLNIIEKTIIDTLKQYKIKSFADRKNIGIWVNHKKKIKKVGAIGIKVKKWFAYHGFSININTDLEKFKKIIPCGIKNRELINLEKIKSQNYKNFKEKIITNFLKNLKK